MTRPLLLVLVFVAACAPAVADEACPPSQPTVLTIRNRLNGTACDMPEGVDCCPDTFEAVGTTGAGEVICVGYFE